MRTWRAELTGGGGDRGGAHGGGLCGDGLVLYPHFGAGYTNLCVRTLIKLYTGRDDSASSHTLIRKIIPMHACLQTGPETELEGGGGWGDKEGKAASSGDRPDRHHRTCTPKSPTSAWRKAPACGAPSLTALPPSEAQKGILFSFNEKMNDRERH